MAKQKIAPETKNVEPQYVEMKVPLYSYGCEKKVKKALKRTKGIYSMNVDYKLQKVTVWGICNRDEEKGIFLLEFYRKRPTTTSSVESHSCFFQDLELDGMEEGQELKSHYSF